MCAAATCVRLRAVQPKLWQCIGESKSLSKEGATYTPLAIKEQHTVCNSYGLAFLNTHLRPEYCDGAGCAEYPAAGADASMAEYNAEYLKENHFGAEGVFKAK